MKKYLIAFLLVLSFIFSHERLADAQAACCSPLAVQPVANLVIAPAGWTDAVVLVANTATTQSRPAGANYAVFSANCNFYAMPTSIGVATVPGVTTTTGAAATLNPTAWSLKGGVSGISLIAPTACVVTVSFYN